MNKNKLIIDNRTDLPMSTAMICCRYVAARAYKSGVYESEIYRDVTVVVTENEKSIRLTIYENKEKP